MSSFTRALSAAAGLLMAGGITVAVWSGSTGTTSTVPSVHTVASVQKTNPAPKIACYFRVSPTDVVLHSPELQPADGGAPEFTDVSDTCRFRIGTKGGAAFVEVITPGKYDVGNGVYPLVHVHVSLKGAYRLDGQPKAGYTLACVSDHGVLKPAPAGTPLTVHTCHLVGLHLPVNAQGVGFELTYGGHFSFYGVRAQAHPGKLHLVSLTVA